MSDTPKLPEPSAGGSYMRDPVTGALSVNLHMDAVVQDPAPASADTATPAPAVDGQLASDAAATPME